MLKSRLGADPGPLQYQVVYTIDCRMAPAKDRDRVYLDTPWPVDSGQYHSHLRGSRAIPNLELYLERNRAISFLVFREYSCCSRGIKWQEFSDSQQPNSDELSPFFSREYIDPVSAEVRTALTDLSNSVLDEIPHPRFDGKKPGRISHPYLWWYHRRGRIDSRKIHMSNDLQQHLSVLQAYMKDRMQSDWDIVDDLTSRGKITVGFLRYIFASTYRFARHCNYLTLKLVRYLRKFSSQHPKPNFRPTQTASWLTAGSK